MKACKMITMADTTGKVKRCITISEVQALVRTDGSTRERRAKVHSIGLSDGSTNCGNAFDTRGGFLFSFGWYLFPLPPGADPLKSKGKLGICG